ncbi:AarF/ABC1/UbiB kinase family protein [Anaeromyxobacter sp. Fw109-5]|uniref:ABC1 kinase family protein n=1 Tax=Anaeromyxobacter sp. (strain Fw109-5) TaxID=404589 RepID=UPI000158A6E8|nr:lipopolysaccharide core heptose(II) kinase RfaY [Anaeromyxobacter sp. Fw109-5]ABS26309.1 ABC-1 domain protein [Anaeromyxobacter sp. Fw109-5]
MLERTLQDLNRLRQIAYAVARHGFGSYLEKTRLRDVLGRDAPPVEGAPPPPPDHKTAARFRQLLAELGPTFTKLGQLLSTRPDVLPSHWIDELEALQDDCPPLPIAEVLHQIERGLGHPVEELFASLDEVPLASASIAQVHRAVTHAGEPVVVKVQRPRIREQIESDLALLHYLARLLEAVIEETGIYTPTDIIEEFDRTVHEELDFGNEARNAREMRDAAVGRKVVVIPRVHAELSSPTILTLDYVEGTKISDVRPENGHDLEQVAKNVIETSFRQLFEDGLFHGDPHPGNILVLPDDRIALLDFGLVGRLTRAQQEALVTLIVAVALRDPDTVARLLNRIGVPDSHTPIADFREDIRAILDRYLGLKLDEIRSATLLRDLLDLAIRHRIRIPKEYAVLAKASITIEGIIRRIYPKLDVLEVGLPYAKELLLSRFNPSDASGMLMKSLLKLQGLAEDVPSQLSQILVDLEGGKFRVNVAGEAMDRIGGHVRALGVMVFLGLLAAGLTVGGLVVLASRSAPVLGWLALGSAVVLSALAAAYHAASQRLRKISLRQLLQR